MTRDVYRRGFFGVAAEEERGDKAAIYSALEVM